MSEVRERPSREVSDKRAWEARRARRNRPDYTRMFFPLVYFSVSVFFLECLLRLTNANISFIGPGLFRCLFSSLAMGAALWLVTTMLPRKGWGRGIAAGVLFLLGAAAIAECCVQDFFGTYYQISYMFGMSGQVAGDFLSEAMGVIVKHLWFFPLALAPGILAILSRSRVVPKHTRRYPRSWLIWVLQAIVLILAQLLNVLFCHVGGQHPVLYDGLLRQQRHSPLRSGQHPAAGNPVRYFRPAHAQAGPG